MAVLSGALDRGLPVLAICRGHELLNVVLGGDLVQYLPDQIGTTVHQPAPGEFGTVAITTEPGSTVHRLLGGRIEALCCHHQAIGSLGRGLVVTARRDDGVIEAVELPGHRFVVGVQWHPEEMDDPLLFEALVEASRLHQPQSPE
jgi:gamma-glutamyl-gamma-aminobutyrate hydrolase PuuD